MCNLLLEFTDKDTTGQADTSYAARIEFIEHELELCGSDFKKPMDLYEKKEWSEDEGDEEKYTYLCTTLEDHEQNLIERKAELIDREKRRSRTRSRTRQLHRSRWRTQTRRRGQ